MSPQLRVPGLAAALLLPAVVLFGACGSNDEPDPVSEQDAVEFLESLAAMGQKGDMTRLCNEAGAPTSACRIPFDTGAAADRPGGRPVVIASDTVDPNETSPNPGRLLTICGVDGGGNRYAGNVLVYRDGDGLMTPYPVFWAGIPIALVEPGVSPTTAAGGANPLMAQCEAANAFD